MVRNDTSSTANFELLRLDAPFEELAQHVVAEQGRIDAGKPLSGPPATVTEVGRLLLQPGTTGSIQVQLTVGTYALMCARFDGDDIAGISVAGPVTVE